MTREGAAPLRQLGHLLGEVIPLAAIDFAACPVLDYLPASVVPLLLHRRWPVDSSAGVERLVSIGLVCVAHLTLSFRRWNQPAMRITSSLSTKTALTLLPPGAERVAPSVVPAFPTPATIRPRKNRADCRDYW